MKVLLIYPPVTTKGKDTSQVSPIPPLGILYIASFIEKKGHNVEIMDCLAEGIDVIKYSEDSVRVGMPREEIKRRIAAYKPDIVGISAMFTSYANDAHDIAAITKSVLPDVPV